MALPPPQLPTADYGGSWTHCYTCKTLMWIPGALNEVALRNKGEQSFYCAYGHGQVYAKGESELDKARRERDLFKQQVAQRDDAIAAAERELEAERKKAKRAAKRTAAGVCQCCQRTFNNVALHMKHMHPEFTVENKPALKVVK